VLDSAYIGLKKECLDLIRTESRRSFEQQAIS